MTSVVSADRDRSRLLQSKQDECSSIARSRKRKIRELFAVATGFEVIPNISLRNPDALPTNEVEAKFLEGCDILQGRKLNELNIPARPRFRLLALHQPTAPGAPYGNENAIAAAPKPPVQDESKAGSKEISGTGQGAGVSLQQTKPDSIPVQKVTETTSASAVVPPQPPPELKQAVHATEKTAKSPSSSQHKTQPSGQNDQSSHAKKGDTVDRTVPYLGPQQGASEREEPPVPPCNPQATPVVVPDIPQAQPIPASTVVPTPSQISNPEVPDLDHMDIDEPAIPAQKPSASLSSLAAISQQDNSLPADAQSSPGSTAQTVTTPAVQEISANTSPDHEGAQYMQKSEDRVEETLKENEVTVPPTQDSIEPAVSFGGTSQEIEAQLLHDSANHISRPMVESRMKKHDAVDVKAADAVEVTKPVETPHDPPQANRPNQTPNNRPSDSTVTSSSHAQKADSNTVLRDTTVTSVSEEQPVKMKAVDDKKGTETDGDQRLDQAAQQSSQSPAPVPQQPDRAVTRVSTGAIRQRSVSEILSGLHPKAASESQPQAPITPISQSPRPRAKSLIEKAKSKEKIKSSTVVFGRQPRKASDSANSVVQSRPKMPGQLPSDDYFTPLFVQGFSNNGTKWMKPLDQILNHAHKTVSTEDTYTPILDNQACRVLRRVYALQQQDKWSLRQPKRCPEPPRQSSHWDVLLKEMKWMRTDFREETKWKIAVARNTALACAEWVSLKDYPEEQKALQVNAITPRDPPKPQWVGGDLQWSREDVTMSDAVDGNDTEGHPTPDLIPSTDTDSPPEHDDDPAANLIDTIPPAAIFALQDDDVVFELHPSPNTDRLLEELPMYGSPLKVPEVSLTAPKLDPDAHWRREALPLSKYVEGRMELTSTQPPRKRSRYTYAQEDDDEEEMFSAQLGPPTRLEPQNPYVALFRPENKSIRDRLHAGHQFRPPHEYSMPTQSFYESRHCSQWTVSEDDELKTLVREYSYNWSLISSMLSTKSEFTASAERRTPWECFERWVMLEGLPHDMQKTQYFKLWQNRIDAAQAAVRQHNQNVMTAQQQQQQNGASGPVTPVPRRRVSIPQKVERRRNQKHFTMIDAMRKLAKKRETALQKQQHAASLAAMRKAQEQPQPRSGPTKTPREYSIMRWERDQAMAERLAERMQQQQQRAEAQRRAAMQARAQQGQAGQLSAQNAGAQLQPNAPHPSAMAAAAAARTNGLNQMAMNGQARPRMPMQGAPNGNGAQGPMAGGALVPPMQMNGNGQVQMPVVNGQTRMPMASQPDMRMVMQAHQISEQQRHAVQLRQAQQQHPMQQNHAAVLQNSPQGMRAAVANGVNQKNYINNAQAMMAALNASNQAAMATSPGAGLTMPNSQAGSPRPSPSMPQQIHQTYLSQLQVIESQIRTSHPNTPQDMVREMAKQVLTSRHNQSTLAQSAMNAAAGGQAQAAIANGPHQYAQLLRAQQQAQAQAAAAREAQQQQQQQQHPAVQHPAVQHQRNSSAGSPTPPVPSVPK